MWGQETHTTINSNKYKMISYIRVDYLLPTQDDYLISSHSLLAALFSSLLMCASVTTLFYLHYIYIPDDWVSTTNSLGVEFAFVSNSEVIDNTWDDQPPKENNDLFIHPIEYAGML